MCSRSSWRRPNNHRLHPGWQPIKQKWLPPRISFVPAVLFRCDQEPQRHVAMRYVLRFCRNCVCVCALLLVVFHIFANHHGLQHGIDNCSAEATFHWFVLAALPSRFISLDTRQTQTHTHKRMNLGTRGLETGVLGTPWQTV